MITARRMPRPRHIWMILLCGLSAIGPAHGQTSPVQTLSLAGARTVLQALTVDGPGANAQPTGTAAAPSAAASTLSPVDYSFVAQANLGAPFQIDSGRVAEQKATTADIRNYAHLMVVSHMPVVDALNAILQQKRITAPPNTLLQGAYDAMIASLKADTRAGVDRDYVVGQIDYQKGNAALFRYEIQNGSDPELKVFAQHTLPKIEDHLERVLKLANSSASASSK